MTIMTRLEKKKLLTKHKQENTYFYKPTLAKQEFETKATSEVLQGLIDGFGQQVFSCLVSEVNHMDPDTIDELEHYIKELKERRKQDV